MNIENISSLATQLQSLGFGDLGYTLLKRSCFKPDSFILPHQIEKGNDSLHVDMFFQKKSNSDEYVLKCYDAVLQQIALFSTEKVNSINISLLEKQMSVIDWKNAFTLNDQKAWNENADFSKEQAVESVISDLIQLEKNEEGKAIASILKLKYWIGTNYYEIFGGITTNRAKGEISQRFFIFEGQSGISIDEAYRFLQNRRMEKEMKRKQVDKTATEGDTKDDGTNSGSGLLKKKRINGTTKKGKHKTTLQ